MGKMIGRNVNEHDEATVTRVTINSLTATTLASANDKRMYLSFCLAFGTLDVDAAIRAYPAAQDNIKQGRDVLTRNTLGNTNLFKPLHEMLADNIYDGEISAIALSGTVNLLITES